MAFGSVTLVPGVNVERTPMLLRAGISQSSLVRFRDGLVQKYGGWQNFIPFPVGGVPRDMHAWLDLNNASHLLVGTTTELDVISSGVKMTITPQTLISNFAPGTNISTTINSNIVGITDPNISNVTTNDTIFFNTPVSIGGLILDGLYQISTITGTHSYQILATSNATSNSTSSAVPVFSTTSGSTAVQVTLNNHGLVIGDTVVFAIPTTGNGVTIFGSYKVPTVPLDANNFTIIAATQATATSSFSMNGGNVQLVYYIALGPNATGTGFGLGGFGSGGFGTGTVPAAQTGNPITATDWTSDNWGEIAVACPKGGGLYFYDPTGGFTNAALISTGPPFNSGMFVSIGAQIMVAYGSSVHEDIGWQQQPNLVQWSDVGDFTDWTPSANTQAGNFTIPTGSQIIGGLAVSNQNLIWTDLDLWAMNYIGPPLVFGFNKIGAGMGLASSHAAQQFRGSIFWMGRTNFYSYTGNGAAAIPCPVWDAVFQNINTNFIQNVRAMPNTPFNEIGWLYPSAASVSGECDSYVKMNVTEEGQPWDYGPLPRSAWIDQSILGMPISAVPNGIIYQQETTPDAAGQPLVSSFTTGFFYLADGENFVIVDQVLPDFKWATFAGLGSAQIQITFNVCDFPGDATRTYGPYLVMQSTEYITTRFRGRLMSITVTSADIGSFWRLGSIKYRYSPAGRR